MGMKSSLCDSIGRISLIQKKEELHVRSCELLNFHSDMIFVIVVQRNFRIL